MEMRKTMYGKKKEIIEFFKEYREKLNTFRVIEIFRFVKFVFPENQNINGLFDFKYDKYLSLVEIKEALENACFIETIKKGIKNNIELAFSEMDGKTFRKLFKLIEVSEFYDGYDLDEFILNGIEDKYIDKIDYFNPDEVLDILNGNEE